VPNTPAIEDEPIRYRGKKAVRITGVVMLAICCVMIVLGLTMDTDRLHPALQLLFWGGCILLAVLALFVALLDIVLLGRASRQRKLKLFQDTFGRGPKP
jgi:hypothetical protein